MILEHFYFYYLKRNMIIGNGLICDMFVNKPITFCRSLGSLIAVPNCLRGYDVLFLSIYHFIISTSLFR